MLKSFSPAIFWDTSIADLDVQKHRAYIMESVLNYGNLEDWTLLKATYTKEQLLTEELLLKNLHPKAVSFLSVYFDLPKNRFSCYSQTPSTPEQLTV